MRLLQVHNFYRQPGGEDAVVLAERKLLESRGWQVFLWSVSNEAIDSRMKAFDAARHAAYSRASRAAAAREIAACRPDVVHVHNFFPLITPSVFDACRDAGVATVQTLHNFRMTCAGGQLRRRGAPCESCITGSPYLGALHRCYRGSLLGSLAVARMIDVHRRRDTWSRSVDRFIALSRFARERFVAAGLPAERLEVLPNFVASPREVCAASRSGALFVGRLSPEKGVETLLRAWANFSIPLRIVGDGPLMPTLRATAPASAIFLGQASPAAVAQEMARAAVLVMPSEWYEGCPMVLLEALAHGLPTVATRIGGIPEIIDDGATGLLVPPRDPRALARAVCDLLEDDHRRLAMERAARAAHTLRYSPDRHYESLQAIYDAARGVPTERPSMRRAEAAPGETMP
jgi:glycosyltransferase involved in cell wall biosynthesis